MYLTLLSEKVDEGREHITKYLQRIYLHVTRESDLFWGLKEGDVIPLSMHLLIFHLSSSPLLFLSSYFFVFFPFVLFLFLRYLINLKDAKRNPGGAPKRPRLEERPTVSEGYGEATLGSVSRLLHMLETLPEEDLRLGSNSTFLDIGSGFGKVVFHAKLFSGVNNSVGIEYPSNVGLCAFK